MLKHLSNKNIQEFPLEIKGPFGKKFVVIIESVREKTHLILQLKFKNAIFKSTFSTGVLYKSNDGQIVFNGSTKYNKTIDSIIGEETFDNDIDNIVLGLTKDIQNHLLRYEAEKLISIYKDAGMNVNFFIEENGENLDFTLFNVENPSRRVTIYLKNGGFDYDFEDLQMDGDDLKDEIFCVDEVNHKKIGEWLDGISFIKKYTGEFSLNNN